MSKNYDILSNREKTDALGQFIGVLLSLDANKRAVLSIVNRTTDVHVAGAAHQYVERSVYLTSRHDFVSVLSGSGFKFTRLDAPLRFPISRENLKSLELADGLHCRAYVVHMFPRTIYPAWIIHLANHSHILNIDLLPMEPSRGRRMLASYANVRGLLRGERNRAQAAEARAVSDRLLDQETVMYEVGITAVVTAPDGRKLEQECRRFEKEARWMQISTMAVPGRQRRTFEGWERRFMMPSQSLTAFWPFTSSDMMAPNGVYLGKNELTNAPVIYDYTRMSNYNMTILGQSGYGKSMTTKTYISNFFRMIRERYADSEVMAYIFDLHGEYAALKDHFGMNVLDLMADEEAGLDPFVLMDKPSQAAAMISEVAGMTGERANLSSIVVSRSEGVGSISEMVDPVVGSMCFL